MVTVTQGAYYAVQRLVLRVHLAFDAICQLQHRLSRSAKLFQSPPGKH